MNHEMNIEKIKRILLQNEMLFLISVSFFKLKKKRERERINLEQTIKKYINNIRHGEPCFHVGIDTLEHQRREIS